MKFPFELTAGRALALTTEIERALDRDEPTADVFVRIEAHASPLMQNIAWFLQTSANYPAAFDTHDLAQQVGRVHDELYDRLQAIKSRRTPPRPTTRWPTWFSRSEATPSDADDGVIQIRVLHFSLNSLTLDLEQRTLAAHKLFRLTALLLRQAEEMRDALTEVISALERFTADLNLAQRTLRLREDLELQTHLVRTVDANLQQRIRFEELTQERVRRLLRVILPMEAVMMGRDVDFSPLDPVDRLEVSPVPAAEDPANPPSEPAATELPMPVTRLIEFAHRASMLQDANNMIQTYFESCVDLLSPGEVLELLKGLTDWNRGLYVREMMNHFIARRSGELTAEYIARLQSNPRTFGEANDLILKFARAEIQRLTKAEMILLCSSVNTHAHRLELMALMGIK
jgi:hypothetical protein